MIKAVIFDCFGVLVQGTLSAFYDRHNLNEEQKREARELDNLASRGYISYEEHVQQLSILADVPFDTTKRELEDNPVNEQLFAYMRTELQHRYKIGFLSNASDDWLDELFTKEQQALFDDVVLSYREKLAKPDERIYTLAAERLGLMPEECVMVDDIERYCTGAREAGMKTVQYKTFASFETDMKRLLD